MNSSHQTSETHNFDGPSKVIDQPQKQHPLEGSSSGVDQKASTFVQDLPNSEFPAPPTNNSHGSSKKKPRKKVLESWFGTCYKVWMLLLSAFFFFGLLDTVYLIITDDQNPSYNYHCECVWLLIVSSLIQYPPAFWGAKKESLKTIERVLIAMKINLCLFVLFVLYRMFEEYQLNQMSKSQYYKSLSFFDATILHPTLIYIGCCISFILYPTIKVKNLIKAAPQDNDNEDVIMRKSIEKLTCWNYLVYEYWMIIYFFWSLQSASLSLYILPKAFEEKNIDMKLLIQKISALLVDLFGLAFSFFVIEGMRRKDLDKVLKSIKLMKIGLVILCVSAIYVHYLMKRDWDNFEDLKHLEHWKEWNDGEDSLIGPIESDLHQKEDSSKVDPYIYFGNTITFIMFYVGIMYGAFEVRGILKNIKKYKL